MTHTGDQEGWHVCIPSRSGDLFTNCSKLTLRLRSILCLCCGQALMTCLFANKNSENITLTAFLGEENWMKTRRNSMYIHKAFLFYLSVLHTIVKLMTKSQILCDKLPVHYISIACVTQHVTLFDHQKRINA